MSLDIAQAYDSVNKKFFLNFQIKVKNTEDLQIVNLMKSLYTNQKVVIGDKFFCVTKLI